MEINSKSLYSLNNSKNELIEKTKLNTNFSNFDEKSGGIFTGELIVIGARENNGLDETIAIMFSNIAKENSVLFISLYRSSNDFKILFQNHILDSNTEKNMLFYHAEENDYTEFQVTLINLIKENNAKLIVIEGLEYLYSFRNSGLKDDMYFLFQLKKYAIQFNVAILLNVPMNRELELRDGEKKPRSCDIIFFDGIEKIADKIIFPYKYENYGFTCDADGNSIINRIDLIIAKNNLKGTDTVVYQL